MNWCDDLKILWNSKVFYVLIHPFQVLLNLTTIRFDNCECTFEDHRPMGGIEVLMPLKDTDEMFW